MPFHPETLPSLDFDYFQFLGIERRLSLDTGDLQERFYQLSRRLHPDRFVRRPRAEREYSEDATAILNDAFRTLRNPLDRAEYVLKQENFDISEQRDVPPELLEEVFELNMALEELRSGDESARPQLEQARQQFAKAQAEIDSQLEEQFRVYDANPAREILQNIRGILNRRRYIQNLIRDVENELAPEESKTTP